MSKVFDNKGKFIQPAQVEIEYRDVWRAAVINRLQSTDPTDERAEMRRYKAVLNSMLMEMDILADNAISYAFLYSFYQVCKDSFEEDTFNECVEEANEHMNSYALIK